MFSPCFVFRLPASSAFRYASTRATKIVNRFRIFDKTKEFEDYFREITDKPYTPFVINYFYPTKKIYNDNSVKPDVTELSKTKIEKIENK